MSHGVAKDEKLVMHRDKFEVIPDVKPVPSTSTSTSTSTALVRQPVVDEDTITVVPNMVVVTDGRGRIGILEWHDRD